MTHPVLHRIVSMAGALILFFGLAAAPAAAMPSQSTAAAPAAAPQAPPAWDWIGAVKCGSQFFPNAPKTPGGMLECAKQAIKGVEKGTELAKDGASAAAKALAGTMIGDAAKAMAEFAGDFMRITFGWWLMTDSVQVKDSGVLGDPDKPSDPTRSLSLHALMVGIGAGIATILVMFQGIKMIILRKGAPLAQVIQGLLINIVVSAAGVGIIDALLLASDQLAKAILYVGFGGGTDVPARMAVVMLPAIANPMGLLTIAIVGLCVGAVQVVMLFLRQAAIPIQALLLPIAGAGQVGGEISRQWLPRLFTAIMVLIVYKPMAALIIAVGFTEMAYGNGILDFVRGVVTLVLSIVALKSLMALFAPLGLSMGTAVAAGGGLAGALSAVGGAIGSSLGSSGGDSGSGGSGGAGGAAGSTAMSHAADMERNRPSSGGGGGSSEGASAVQQSSASIPSQGGGAAAAGGESAAAAAEGATAAAGAGQAAAGGSTAAASTATAAAGGAATGGAVTVALVAAEATKQAVNKAGGAVGGTE
ncbi:hypothetical protein BJP40_00105 [Streptomyces sp. CC53]|uniref:hypothetical protein n=1 Tax=Streptomyces sp. CC53 TaxID=1906740 RepID=UPI0008DD8A6D|nr:hypothetical protein [Streptomyces sp. CC53]OII64307.1 hypothetical protein BJP40_00105 [Streptomyces sp. CC53]